MGKQTDLSEYQHRLTPDQAQRQQVLRAELLKRYDDVHPSGYSPVVVDNGGTTFRFFVRRGDVLAVPATMVEVRDTTKGRRT